MSKLQVAGRAASWKIRHRKLRIALLKPRHLTHQMWRPFATSLSMIPLFLLQVILGMKVAELGRRDQPFGPRQTFTDPAPPSVQRLADIKLPSLTLPPDVQYH